MPSKTWKERLPVGRACAGQFASGLGFFECFFFPVASFLGSLPHVLWKSLKEVLSKDDGSTSEDES